MKTVLDASTRTEVIDRIAKLDSNSKPLWGKMNVYQMVKHCGQWEEMALSHTVYKQSFLGKIFGKVALKSMLKDEPVKKNIPTVPSFVITGDGDVEAEKARWVGLLGDYTHHNKESFIHPFFGKMTREQAGIVCYKHADHHLKQFGV